MGWQVLRNSNTYSDQDSRYLQYPRHRHKAASPLSRRQVWRLRGQAAQIGPPGAARDFAVGSTVGPGLVEGVFPCYYSLQVHQRAAVWTLQALCETEKQFWAWNSDSKKDAVPFYLCGHRDYTAGFFHVSQTTAEADFHPLTWPLCLWDTGSELLIQFCHDLWVTFHKSFSAKRGLTICEFGSNPQNSLHSTSFICWALLRGVLLVILASFENGVADLCKLNIRPSVRSWTVCWSFMHGEEKRELDWRLASCDYIYGNSETLFGADEGEKETGYGLRMLFERRFSGWRVCGDVIFDKGLFFEALARETVWFPND